MSLCYYILCYCVTYSEESLQFRAFWGGYDAKLSAVLNCPFLLLVPNCVGAKLSYNRIESGDRPLVTVSDSYCRQFQISLNSIHPCSIKCFDTGLVIFSNA